MGFVVDNGEKYKLMKVIGWGMWDKKERMLLGFVVMLNHWKC